MVLSCWILSVLLLGVHREEEEEEERYLGAIDVVKPARVRQYDF
jgi:hypothetical protein